MRFASPTRFAFAWPGAAQIRAAAAALALGTVPAMGNAQPSPPPSQAAPAERQLRAFPAPEAAVRALIAGIQAPTMQPLEQIVGRQVLDSIPLAERQSTEMRRATGDWLASQPFEVSYVDGTQRTRAVALFGATHVPLPAVLVRTQRGWSFDPAATVAAVRERRIGINEANALRALHDLARAQERYRLSDRSGDGVLQYAQRILSSAPGRLDGLVVRQIVPGESLDLLNAAFGEAEGEPGDRRLNPPAGYAYRILTGQGPNAEGGERSYMVDGRMTEGFAVVAWPVRPGETGLSTFIMNQRGVIFEREFGADTMEQVRRITGFNPGPDWHRTDAE
jgi:hypothetical protein